VTPKVFYVFFCQFFFFSPQFTFWGFAFGRQQSGLPKAEKARPDFIGMKLSQIMTIFWIIFFSFSPAADNRGHKKLARQNNVLGTI
jgi:hypothetical protein